MTTPQRTPGRTLRRAGLIAAACTLAFGAAQAQSQDQDQAAPPDAVADLLRARGEAYSRAPDSEQVPAEVDATRRLNSEIVAGNALAEQAEEADLQARAQDEARYRSEVETNAQVQADILAEDADRNAAYQDSLRVAEEQRAQYAREMDDWRATVAACDRGDVRRCRAGAAPTVYAAPR